MSFRWPVVLWCFALWAVLALAGRALLRRRSARAITHPGVGWLSARSREPWAAFGGALLLATLAAARPVAPWPAPAGWPVVLVVDVSRSMEETDIAPSRLEAAKRAAVEFLRRLPRGIRVGLVTFGNFASVVVPLTADRERVAQAVWDLTTQLRTQLGAGLLEAVRVLEQEGAPQGEVRGVVVLLSDGRYSDGPTPQEATDRAVQARVRVYTVGIATTRPAHLLRSGFWGLLDEPTLQAIAERTGGRYYRTTHAGQLRHAYQDLARRTGWRWAPQEVGALFALASAALLAASVFRSVRRAPLTA
jgi:Ca-activated chloride channel family protein